MTTSVTTSATTQPEGIEFFVKAYQALLKDRPGMLASELGGELTWLRKARERDAHRWQTLGLPSRRSERWRYTNLAPLAKAAITVPREAPSKMTSAVSTVTDSGLPSASRAAFPAFETAAAEIVFLNGRYVPAWSRSVDQAGVSVAVLSQIFEECVAKGWTKERMERFAAFRQHIETSDADRETVFASMNTSFMQDAVLIRVDAATALEKPIVVSYFSDPAADEGLMMSSPRVFIHLEKAARASVIECYAGTDDRRYFTNSVSDLRLEDGASLCHCKIQLESQDGIHIGTTRVHQKRDSQSETHQFSFGASLSRQDLHVSLEAEGAHATLGGLYAVGGRQHVDNYTLVDHVSPHTSSEQLYKGILDDESRAVFNGHVRIMRDAQKANANQLNNNLLLSPQAEVDTRPELEIDADDVKATHGATIGRLDPEHVFYLQARAISHDAAVKILARGFAQDVAFRIRDRHVREILIDLVARQFENLRAEGLDVDVNQVRADFPILAREVRGRPLVYLDSAASSLKPNQVIDRITQYYRNETSNVHRGAHFLSEQGTIAYEDAREVVSDFVGAAQASEIVFTRGTTESINLVAQSYGRKFLQRADEIILSEMEHHSNIVPWQMIAEEKGCQIKVIPVDDAGDLDFEAFTALLTPRTKIVALAWCSNALGTVNDVEKFVRAAHAAGAKVLIDGAQGVAQFPTDVRKMDCDFFAFSGHKVFGPYGIGALYGKAELLEAMPPYQGGGSMISEVTWDKTTWAAVPHKFEAGTPEISGAVGLASALRYVKGLGFDGIVKHEHELLELATRELKAIPGLRIIGEPRHKAAILSFVMDGAHASDIGALIDQQGVAVRAGHHCCQPLMRRFGIPATARASFSIYNSREDVAALKASLLRAKEIFS